MDSRKEIKVGDEVLCIKEPYTPNILGSVWKVTQILHNLYYCVNYELDPRYFIFQKDEIVIPSSLIKELL
jgi:hypothetical protein